MKHEIQIATATSAKEMIHELVEDAKATHLLSGGVRAGDTKVVWDPENEDEVAAAKATYDRLLAKGFTAFQVKEKGEQGKKMTAWDPEAGKIIMIPKIAGGTS